MKLPAKDVLKTTKFYTEVLPFQRDLKLDHQTPPPESRLFATILCWEEVKLEIRQNEDWAEKTVGVDHITWTVDKREDLEHWTKWLDEKGVNHSRIFTGFSGWAMSVEDPDGRIVRLYTKEEHEWTTETDRDEYWLRN